MDRSTFESAAIFLLVLAMFIVGHSLNLDKLNRRYAQRTAPILKANRLPFRFSIRSLLIATTLFAVMMGLVVWMGR